MPLVVADRVDFPGKILGGQQCTQNLNRKKPRSVSITRGRMSCSTTALSWRMSMSLGEAHKEGPRPAQIPGQHKHIIAVTHRLEGHHLNIFQFGQVNGRPLSR